MAEDSDPFANWKQMLQDPGGYTPPAPQQAAPDQQDQDSDTFKQAKLADIKRRESGGQNVPNAQGSGALGYYQFMPGTWKEGLQLAGLHPDAYDTPLSAPEDVQDKVASAVYDKYGEKPWAASATGPLAPPPSKTDQAQVDATAPKPEQPIDYSAALNQYMPTTAQDQPDTTSWGGIRGFNAGVRGWRQMGLQLHATQEALMGDDNGMRDLMSVNTLLEKRTAAEGPAKDFHQLIQNGTVGEWLDWLSYNAGEQVPNLALLVTTDGAGSLLGYAARLGARAVAKGTITELAEREATAAFMKRGGLIGAYLGASAQASGQIAAEQYQATGELSPGVAITGGLAAGIPGVIAPNAIVSRLGLAPKWAGNFAETMRNGITDIIGSGFLRRRAAGAVAYAGEFAGASAVQAAVMDAARAYVDKHYEFLGPDTANRILDAAASGALSGATFGIAVPAMHPDLVRHLNHAVGKDPSYAPTPFEETKQDDPRLMQAFPGSQDNPAVNEVYKGIRQAVVEAGGFDALDKHSQDKALSRTPTLEDLQSTMFRVEALLKQQFMGTDITDSNGSPMKVTNTDIDLKRQIYTLFGAGDQFKIVPLSELPIARLTQQVLKEHPGPIGELVPKGGITAGRSQFLDNDVGVLHVKLGNALATYSGSDFMDRAGRDVDMKQPMKPNQVVYTSKEGFTTLAPRQKRLLESYLRHWAPGAKLIVDEHDFSPFDQPGATGGWFMNLGDQHYLIRLSTRGDQAWVGNTMAHELGHLIFWHHFNDASFAQKMALYNSYTNTWKDITDSNLLDVMRQNARPQMQSWIHNNLYTAERMKKWWDFDEWGAEGFVKYLLGQRGAAFDKFFSGAASKFTDMIKALNDNKYNVNPNEVMANWFDKLRSRPATGIGMIADQMLKSSEANAKLLGERLDPADTVLDRIAKAPPEMAENMALEDAAAKGIIPRAIRAQADKFSWFTKHIWNIMQVARQNPHIQDLSNISNLLQMFHARRMNWAIEADHVLKLHNALGKERSAMVDKLLTDLDMKQYLRPDEPNRWPRPEEMRKIIVNAGIKPEDWAKVQPVYEGHRDYYMKVLGAVEDSAIAKAKLIADPASQAAKITQISNQMNSLRAGPYFPHSRYGDFGVGIRSEPGGKRLHYEMFWTKRQAEAGAKTLMDKYRKEGHPNAVYEYKAIPNEVRDWIGLPAPLLDTLRELPGITLEQHEWIDNLRFEMSPENSFAKRFQHRSGIAGYDMNSARSFANYASSASGHLARLEFQDQLSTALKGLRNSVNTDFSPQDPKLWKRSEIADWADKQIQYIMHPPNEMAAVRSFAFQWWLGFNPSTAFVHLMQMPMFTAPYMSKYYGAGSVMRMLGTYGEMRALYRGTGGALEPSFENALKRAVLDGFMTENRGVDLASWVEYGIMGRSAQGTARQRFLKQFLNKTGSILRLIEKNNRTVTFRAAWKEAMRDPNNRMVQDLVQQNRLVYDKLLGEGERPETAAAYIAGRDAVQQTHFSYTQVARPQFMRGIMSPIMTFMSYKQQALHFFLHNPAGIRALAMVAATSGLTGLPFEKDISDFIKFLSEKFLGTRFDPNEEIEKIAAELHAHPEVIMHGLGREQLGMPHLFNSLGIPWLVGDFSRRLGYGEMIPGMAEATRDQQESFMERFGNTSAAALGAGLEVPLQVGKVMQDLNVPYTMQKLLEHGVTWQNVRGLEWVMPSVLRNTVEAARYAAQGGDVSARGKMQTPIDINDAQGQSAAIERMLGFSPTDITRGAEVNDTTAQVKAFWTVRKAVVISDFVNARTMGDDQAIADTTAAVRAFNDEAPVPQMKIHPQALIEAIRTRRKEQNQQITPLERSILPQYPEYQAQLQNSGMPTSNQQ